MFHKATCHAHLCLVAFVNREYMSLSRGGLANDGSLSLSLRKFDDFVRESGCEKMRFGVGVVYEGKGRVMLGD